MKARDIVIVDPTLEDALDFLVDGPKQISFADAETIYSRLTEAKSWQKGILPLWVDVHGDRIKVGFSTGNPAVDRAFQEKLKPSLGMFAANITFGSNALTSFSRDMEDLALGDVVLSSNGGQPLGAKIKTFQFFVRRINEPSSAMPLSIPITPALAL